MTRIIVARHGESTFNVLGKVQGQSLESVLTDKGREDAHRLASGLKALYGPISAVYPSDLPRASETALIIAHELGIEKFQIVPGFREIGRGIYEGREYSDAEFSLFEARVRAGEDYFPMGSEIETHAQAIERIMDAFSGVAKLHSDGILLVVSHGEIIKVLLSRIEGHSIHDFLTTFRQTYRLPNCSFNEFFYSNGRFELLKKDCVVPNV